MAVTYNSTLKANRMTLMSDQVNGKTFTASGGAGAAGKMVIGTSSLSGATGVLATLTVPNPAFSIAGGVATLLGVPISATASATGTAALAELRTSADVTVVSGLTVGVGTGDVQLNSVAITSGQTVTITATSTITHS